MLSRFRSHLEMNVMESDGTLVFSEGDLIGECEAISTFAERHNRPWLHIDLNKTIAFKAAREISAWIVNNNVEILNVCGPDEEQDLKFYQATADILQTTFYMGLVEINLPDPFCVPNMKNALMKNIPPPLKMLIRPSIDFFPT